MEAEWVQRESNRFFGADMEQKRTPRGKYDDYMGKSDDRGSE